MNPYASGPGTGSVRLVVNGDELAGVKAGGTWVFGSTVDGVVTNYAPTDDPAPVVMEFARAVVKRDAAAADELRQLAGMLDAVVKGGAP